MMPALATHPLEARCDSWGLALRWRLVQGQTAGIEGDYRSPQHWDALVPTSKPAIDVDDAREIESAVCVLDLYHHALLRSWHVYLKEPSHCLRLASKASGQERGKASGFDSSLLMAYGLLGEALSMPAVIRKDRARERVRALLGPVPGHLQTVRD